MSVLLEVRESEGPSIFEGIIQQPGPFYINNPSSYIWGNSPRLSHWHDSTYMNSCLSGSLTSSPSLPSGLVAPKKFGEKVANTAWGSDNNQRGASATKNVAQQSVCRKTHVSETEGRSLFSSSICSPDSEHPSHSNADSSRSNCLKGLDGLDIPKSRLSRGQAVNNGLHGKFEEGSKRLIFEASAKAFVDREEQERTVNGMRRGIANQLTSSCDKHVEADRKSETQCLTVPQVSAFHSASLHSCTSVASTISSVIVQQQAAAGQCLIASDDNNAFVSVEQTADRVVYGFPSLASAAMDLNCSNLLKEGNNVFVFGASGPSRTSVNAKASMRKAGYTGGGHKGKSKKVRSLMKGRGPGIQRAPDFTGNLFPADGSLDLPMQPSCQGSSLSQKCPDFATCSAGSCLESKAGIYHFKTQPTPNHRIGKGEPAESSQDDCKGHISSLADDKCYVNSSMEWRTSFKLAGTSDCKISELFPEINSNSSSEMEESGPLPRCREAEKPAVADRIDHGTIHDIENSVRQFLESIRQEHKPEAAMKSEEQISNTDSKEVQMTNTIISPGSNIDSQNMEPPFVFGSSGNSKVADDGAGAVRPSLGDSKLTKKFPKGDHAVKETKDSDPHEQPQSSGDSVTVKIENSNRVGSKNLAHIGPFTACSGVLFAECSSNSSPGNAERLASMAKEFSDPVCSESTLNGAGSCQSSSLGHCFVFQGSDSGAPGKSTNVKKKLQRSLNLPKSNRRSVLKQKASSERQRRLNADVMKTKAGVSINFSSCNKESSQTLEGSSYGVNLEDTSLCQEDLPSASMTKETGKSCTHGFECPNVQELRAATARLSIREEEGKASFKNESGSSGQWRIAFVTSEYSTSEQEEKSELDQTWPSHAEENKQQQSVCHSNSAADGQETKHFETFTFSAKSPSIMSTSKLCRQARKLQRGMPAGKSQKPSVFRNITRQDVCKTADLGRLPEDQNVPCQEFVFDSSNSTKTKTNLLVEINHDLLNINKQKTVEEQDIVSPVNLDPPAHCLDSKTASASALKAEQICEQWRLRGNQAYADGDFSKAEECYSRGVRSVSQSETSQSCIRACMLCYSNRAATRMSVGRIREALADCVRAMALDSSFLRVQLRAASCHLSLGETKSAFSIFSTLLDDKAVQKSNPKLRTEAMEGIKKCQQADNFFKRAVELSSKFSDLPTALRLLDEALIISPYSEALLEQKAKVLLSLQRHEDVVKLCEQSFPSAEINHNMVAKKQLHKVQKSPLGCSTPYVKIWRCHMSAKALFHLGRLEESLDLLQKQDDAITACSSNMSSSNDSSRQLMSVINDLLHHKTAGNEAFQAGKHAEAVEHYTAALACNGESWPFNAVCFCNRAAASQALGHIADAISDCSRAIALDPQYPKALSRRATLFEMVRDFHGASNDLRRLITLLEGYQLNNQEKLPYKVGDKKTLEQDMKKARRRLVKAIEEAKKDYPLDHYLLLGVDISSSVNEIKKAYRRAALKHHPDKAGHFLTRENGGETSVLKVGEEVCRDAERLFKMIGEAYGVLSDTGKRSQYDMEEEDRKLKAENRVRNHASSSKRYGSQNESHGGRYGDRGGGWKRYPHHHQRWQCGPDAAEPDTYARRSNFKSGQRTYRSPGFYTYEV